MFEGKNKAITFSYDDGVTQDIRLIEIFNKYNLKATFNLNSSLLGKKDNYLIEGVNISHNKVCANDVKYIYNGHEIAVHTLTHPNLALLSDNEIIKQVECDREKLSELAGYEVYGMAYPGPPSNFNNHIVDVVKNNTSVKYARTIYVTHGFDISDDLYQYKGTLCHHSDWNILFETAQKFLELKSDEPQAFYIWGHSYEFDIYPERWRVFEEFCNFISNKSDIFYGTNMEVFSLIK